MSFFILVDHWDGAQSGVVFKEVVTAFASSFQRLKEQTNND